MPGLNSWYVGTEDLQTTEPEVLDIGDPEPLIDFVEQPEVLEAHDQFSEIEISLEQYHNLFNELTLGGGMTRRLAEEARALMPNFDNGRALGNYTTEPSGVRYRPALEDISKGMMAAIAAGIAVMLGVLYKLIRWMTGGKSKGGGGGGGGDSKPTTPAEIKAATAETAEIVKDAAETAGETAKAADILEKAVNAGVEVSVGDTGKTKKVNKIRDLLEASDKMSVYEGYEKIMLSRDGVVGDILYGGPYSKYMDLLVRSLKDTQQYANSVTMFTKLMDKVLLKQDMSGSVNAEGWAELNRLLAADLGTIKLKVGGVEKTVGDIREDVASARAKSTAHVKGVDADISTIASRIEYILNSSELKHLLAELEDYTIILSDIADELDNQCSFLERHGEKWATKAATEAGEVSPSEVIALVRKRIRAYSAELSGLSMVGQLVVEYRTTFDNTLVILMQHARKLLVEVMHCLAKSTANSDDAAKNEELRKMVEEAIEIMSLEGQREHTYRTAYALREAEEAKIRGEFHVIDSMQIENSTIIGGSGTVYHTPPPKDGK